MSQLTRKLALGFVGAYAIASSVYAQQQPLPPPPPRVPIRGNTLPKRVVLTNAPQAIQAAPVVPATNNTLSRATNTVTATTNTNGAKIKFASTVYDFGKVKAGDPVKVTFTFTNVGTQTLELTSVSPQCGCTVAGEWTKKVEPGKTGEIPLQFNTTSYHGQVFKTITVACTDPMQPHVLLQLRGNIWKPIDLVPPYTVMNILPDMTNAIAMVKIVNNMEQPLEVMEPVCETRGFSAVLTTNQPGKEFQIKLTAAMPLNPGTVSGKVTVKTSATNAPTLDVPFWANVQAPVMVLPPQVMLPSGPLAAKASPTVTIQNNTTNSMSLSDPKVSLPGVDVQVKELQPGRIFSAQLSFPEGFELKPGEQASLTFKTTHPRFAEVKVPIYQMAKLPNLNAPGQQLQRPRLQATPTQPAGKIALPKPSVAQ